MGFDSNQLETLPVTKSPSMNCSIIFLLKFIWRFFLWSYNLSCVLNSAAGISDASHWLKRIHAGKEFDGVGWQKWAGQWCENLNPFCSLVVFVVSASPLCFHFFWSSHCMLWLCLPSHTTWLTEKWQWQPRIFFWGTERQKVRMTWIFARLYLVF